MGGGHTPSGLQRGTASLSWNMVILSQHLNDIRQKEKVKLMSSYFPRLVQEDTSADENLSSLVKLLRLVCPLPFFVCVCQNEAAEHPSILQ